ncbi:MAG: hypothetical protein IPP98_09650 [Gemmatimonadetes bacterium]|nr:hypothetical protein [Gemmatimonadota bacterium]
MTSETISIPAAIIQKSTRTTKAQLRSAVRSSCLVSRRQVAQAPRALIACVAWLGNVGAVSCRASRITRRAARVRGAICRAATINIPAAMVSQSTRFTRSRPLRLINRVLRSSGVQ